MSKPKTDDVATGRFVTKEDEEFDARRLLEQVERGNRLELQLHNEHVRSRTQFYIGARHTDLANVASKAILMAKAYETALSTLMRQIGTPILVCPKCGAVRGVNATDDVTGSGWRLCDACLNTTPDPWK